MTSHRFWHGAFPKDFDDEIPVPDPAERTAIPDALHGIDLALGEIVAKLGPEDTVLIASDHGFGARDHSVDLNQYLSSLGLLRWSGEGVIDHAKSLVFHNMWHLHFNRELLDAAELGRRGILLEAGEAPEDALARHLQHVAHEISAPSGERFPVELVRLPADAVGNAPDMAVQATPDFWVEFWNVDRPSPQVVRRLENNERWKHARDGILAVWGPGVRSGHDLGVVDIQDVAPTLLDLLGLPVADDLDGEIIPLLDADAAAARPLQRVASFSDLSREAVTAPDDPASFEETLRALGYVRD